MPFDVRERYLPAQVVAGSPSRTAAEPGLDLREADSDPMAQTGDGGPEGLAGSGRQARWPGQVPPASGVGYLSRPVSDQPGATPGIAPCRFRALRSTSARRLTVPRSAEYGGSPGVA
jgi:hypothetical protein